VIPDLKWQFVKLLSHFHSVPPLAAFRIGERLVDESGESLLAGPEEGSIGFRPASGDSMFQDCEEFEFVMRDSRIVIGIHEERSAWVSYNYNVLRDSGPQRMAKLRYLLALHSDDGKLREYVDNGSAVLYTAANGAQLAAYGYLTDILVVYASWLRKSRSEGSSLMPPAPN
jgi:hypothetical protein